MSKASWGWAAALCCLALLAVPRAQAQIQPSALSLAFAEPTGTVGPSDTIPVILRLTNTSPGDAFTIDPAQGLMQGLGAAFIPTTGHGTVNGQTTFLPFATYSSISVGTWMGCTGTFVDVCEPGAYTFDWTGNEPFGTAFTLAPGASHDYLWGSFIPTGGTAPAGDYVHYDATLGVSARGTASDGTALFGVFFFASTCSGDSDSACVGQSVFRRTVSAVPESAPWGLMLLGLLPIGAAMQTRRTARAANA